jgi:hypothetical protein
MIPSPSRVVLACAAASLAALAPRAHAFQSQFNAHGQGQARASAWIFPNQPPGTPTFDFQNTFSPNVNFGPFPGADPRTHALAQGTGDNNWRFHGETRAANGDTIDWHSMLPHVTPADIDSSGMMDIVGEINFGPGSATFTVTWSATDAGTAMHIGWFEGGVEIFETPIMTGPFSRVDTFTITSNNIDLVMLETSMASTSIPAPGALALLGPGLVMALRRKR